jgi:ADP-ribose 1''-phosphate phosphatase
MTASNIILRKGDLFTSPPANTILLHACNCIGSWGGGIALAFKQKFPSAFETYREHCRAHSDDPRSLIGTCLIIRGASEKYDIGCLFTSVGYGKHVDPPPMILNATRKAVQDLMQQNSGKNAKEIHSWCQIHILSLISGSSLSTANLTQVCSESLGLILRKSSRS